MAKCQSCGKGGMFLKLDAKGLCVNCLSRKYAEQGEKFEETNKKAQQLQWEMDVLKAQITPEMNDAIQLESLIFSRKQSLSILDDTVADTKKQIAHLQSQIDALQQQLVVVQENVEMESFSLYHPKFAFTTSEEYKERLVAVRDQQKDMIKRKVAATCSTDWTVNGSKTEGKKFTTDMSKLFIRAFNNECDAAVSDVKFSNFAKCRERITKSFDAINKLGRVNHVALSYKYMDLKLDELALAHEYQCKKEEERETLRALKAQQREEAKLAKEIAEARKEAEKERKHYLQALEKLKQQATTAETEEERAAIADKQNELIGHLDDLNQKMEDIDYRQNNQRAGYVYIISNIGSFGEGVYKIGMTRRLDPMERIYELGDASVPFIFDVHAMIFSDDAPKLEAALHQAFADKRINLVNKRREYFRVSLDEIKEVVRENHDKTVEFVDVPLAWQYRETQLMR